MPVLKIVTLVALIAVAASLRNFTSRHELFDCIDTCEKVITPCIDIKNRECGMPYVECIDGKDPY